MLHRSHCFSCRILKLEVCAQVAPEGPECPANTVLAGNISPPRACQESDALRSTQQAASVYAAPPCAAAEEEKVNSVWWRAGHHRNNNHMHGQQRTWWGCVTNREALIKWIPSGAWMRADGVHLSRRINRKEEVRHLKVVIWKQTAETERFQLNDVQHTFLWLALMLTVWPRLIHGQWTLSGTFVLFLFYSIVRASGIITLL